MSKSFKPIYVVSLENRHNSTRSYIYKINKNTNPLKDNLKELKDKDIENVRSFDEICNEDYIADEQYIFETRFREINSEYKIISEEILDYYNIIKSKFSPDEAELEFKHTLEMLNISKNKIDSYKLLKRDFKINEIINGK